jgi:biotin transporter BioY
MITLIYVNGNIIIIINLIIIRMIKIALFSYFVCVFYFFSFIYAHFVTGLWAAKLARKWKKLNLNRLHIVKDAVGNYVYYIMGFTLLNLLLHSRIHSTIENTMTGGYFLPFEAVRKISCVFVSLDTKILFIVS